MTNQEVVCCLQHFAPCPGDTPAVLLSKQQKLLFVKQVYEAWLAQAVCKPGAQQELACVLQADKEQHLQLHAPAPCGVNASSSPAAHTLRASGLDHGCPISSCRIEQPAPSLSELRQQEPSSLQQQHGPAPVQPRRSTLRQLLGTASTDGLPAGDMEHQSDQGHPEQLQQQQQGQTTMPPPPAVQQPTSHKQLLARLLQPGNKHEGAAAAAAAGPWSGASIPNTRQQQQKQRASFGAAPAGRQRRLQHGRFSLLDMPANLAPGAEGRLGPWQHDPIQESCGDTTGPLEQQQLLHSRAHYLLDAQSQAPGAAAAAAEPGGAPAVPEPAVFAGQQRPASTAQQLLSPKTATHAPLQAAGSGASSRHGGRTSGGPTSSSMQRSKDAQAVGRTDRHAQSLSALLKQQRPQQQQETPLPQEQPEEIEVTPSQAPAAQPAPGAVRMAAPSGFRGQAWGSGLAAVAAGGTNGALHAPRNSAHAFTAPRAAAAECGDTPATADADLVAAVGSRRAAAAAAAGLAAALFHTPAPVTVRGRAAATARSPLAAEVAAAAAGAPPPGTSAAADVDFVAGSSPLDETQPSAAQPVGAACGSASAILGPTPTEEDAGLAAVAAADAAAAAIAAAAADIDVVAGSSPVDETQPPSQRAEQQQMSMLLADPGQVPGAAGMLPAPVGLIARLQSAPGGQPSPVLVAGSIAAAAAGTGAPVEQAPERIPATPISSAGCDTGVLQQRCSGAARHRLSGASLAHDLLPSFAAVESPAGKQTGNSGVAAVPDGIPGSSMSSGQLPPHQHQQQEQWEQDGAQQQQQQQDATQQQQERQAAGRTAQQSPPEGAGEEVQQQGQQDGVDVCPAAAAGAVGAAAVSRKRTMQQAACYLPRPKQPRPSPLNPAYRLSSCQGAEVEPSATPAGAAAGGPQSPAVATAACSSTSSILLNRQQHRVQRLDLGLPVVHITSCSGYAAVVLQAPQGSTTYNLLLLQIRTLQQHHDLLACQQQPQHISVELTAVCAPALVGPSHQTATPAPPPPAAGATAGRLAASAQQQHSSKGSPNLLKSGLLLLPGSSSSGHSAAGGCTEQLPLLAVVSQLHLQAHGSQTAAATTPAQAAPAAAGAAPHIDAQQGTGSSSRRKMRVAAADTGGTPVGGDNSHAVNIYRLEPAAGQAAAGGSVCECPRELLVQSLPTARPVKCLAACAQPGLLAAAGAGGFACMWPLVQQQQPAAARDQAKADVEAGGCGTGLPGATCSYVDAAACMVLPAAHYRGIEFPDIAEVCFIVQGASGPVQHQQQGQHGEEGASAMQQQGGQQQQQQQQQQRGPSSLGLNLSGGQKVLLVGCCSQGPVAVWDVGLCQQVLSVHSPEVRLCGLMLPGGAAAVAAFGAAVRAAQAGGGGLATGASTIRQQLPRLTDPVVCLAMAWSPDCSSSEGTPPPIQAGAAAAAEGAAVSRQAQQKQLRGVWLDADGHMQLGRPLVQPGPGCGVSAAALCGSTAAVLTTGGAAQVWDVVSGKRYMCMKRCSTATAHSLGAVALVPLMDPAAVDDDCRSGELHRQASSTGHGGLVMLMGSSAGMLTSVLV